MKVRKVLATVLATAMVAAALAGCGNNNSAATSSKSEAPAATSSSTASATDSIQYIDLSGQDIVVGVASGSSGTSWRDQSMAQLSVVLDEYKASGDIKDYKIVNNTTNGDANEQATIIRNFIDDPAVNVILINPNDATALNEAIEDATKAGKLVVVFDATVTAEGILNVTNDHYSYAYDPTIDLCDALGGKGSVVEISGLDGHPADVIRIEATQDAIDTYNGDIELLANNPGGWDNTTAKSVMASYLSSGMKPDGIISQDSECYGVLQACLDADYLPKVMNGDGTKAFFNAWKELLDAGEDFQAIVKPNPPAISASAARLAICMAKGKTFKEGVLVDGNTFMYQVSSTITNDNFEDYWDEVQELSDEECLDEYLTLEQAESYFN